MKKALLLSTALAFAVSGFAQNANSVAMNNSVKRNLFNQCKVLPLSNGEFKTIVKTLASGTFYARPEGSLWLGWNEQSKGSAISMLSIPSWQDVTFTNLSTAKTGAWHLNNFNGNNLAKSYNISDLAVEGNLVWSQGADAFYSMPTLVNGTDSFTLGEDGYYLLSDKDKSECTYLVTDSIRCHPAVDDHEVVVNDDGTYDQNTYSFGNSSLTNNYLFGTGTLTSGTSKLTILSAEQYFGITAAPLYVESFFISGVSTKTSPIAAGDTLKMYIVKATEKTTSKGTKFWGAGDEIIDTLYATAADTVNFKESFSSSSGTTFHPGVIKFSKRTIDPISGESASVGFVIPKGIRYVAVVAGLDDPNVELGISGIVFDSNQRSGEASGRFSCTDGTAYYNYGYSAIAAGIYLKGMYDAVSVPENGVLNNEPTGIKYNVLRVSADGKTITTDGQETSSSYNMSGAFVGTRTEWFDGDGNDNYTVTNLPTWITGVQVDNSIRSKTEGLNIVTFEVSALPAGTTGRAAVVYVNGKGVTGNNPIYILQGDAKITDGISNVKTDKVNASSAVYNLNGQRVSKATKGILIQNGEKFINK
jgi:hypothetical protein